MTTTRVRSLEELRRVLKRDMQRKEKAVHKAMTRTARKVASILRRNVPVAFSELRDSVEIRGTRIVVDAPHAAAVNNGSRPHMPPIEPILRWVKLRGMQGLAREKSRRRLPGSTTYEAATSIANLINAMGAGTLRGTRRVVHTTSVDVPMQIAWAIAMGIAKKGTRPHHFIEKTAPQAFAILDQEILKVFREGSSAA